jgi:uncharacterized membrane protein YdjX (TVP38/TMEM64 family)
MSSGDRAIGDVIARSADRQSIGRSPDHPMGRPITRSPDHPMVLTHRVRLLMAVGVIMLIAAWGLWSYRSGGIFRLLADAGDMQAAMTSLRAYVLSWGALAPLVYVAAVVVEVLVAPFPGTLLYAPAGAIFGGFWGGTLSLAGNVTGAAVAAFIGRALGEEWVSRKLARGDHATLKARILARGVWVIVLLRANPLTSSDIVSYLAGAIGMRVRDVALGTLGMAPLCYAQAYLAQTLFEVLPGGVWILAGAGVVYVAIVIWLLVKK